MIASSDAFRECVEWASKNGYRIELGIEVPVGMIRSFLSLERAAEEGFKYPRDRVNALRLIDAQGMRGPRFEIAPWVVDFVFTFFKSLSIEYPKEVG